MSKLVALYKKLAADRTVDRVFWTVVEVGAGLLAKVTLFPHGLAGFSGTEVAAGVAVLVTVVKEVALRNLAKVGGPVTLPPATPPAAPPAA